MAFTQICPLCGATNSIDNEFCGSCRVYLGWDRGSDSTADDTDLLEEQAGNDHVDPVTSIPAVSTDWAAAAPATRNTATQNATISDAQPQRFCPRCSTRNDPTLRFCRKCGSTLTSTARPITSTTSAPPTPWWRRWFPSDGEAQQARRAYRHSLPLRYRAQRILAALLIVVGIGAGSTLLGHNPAAWIKDRWADLQNSLIQVADVQAVSEPAEAALTDFPAAAAVDNRADTAWATAWTSSTAPPPSCQAPSATPAAGSTGSLLLLFPQSVTVRAIGVLPGLPDNDPRRAHQWRPKTLQVGFSDGECQQVTLTDSPELQQLDLTPTATTAVRISVVDTFAASPDQPSDLVALGEVRLLRRP